MRVTFAADHDKTVPLTPRPPVCSGYTCLADCVGRRQAKSIHSIHGLPEKKYVRPNAITEIS